MIAIGIILLFAALVGWFAYVSRHPEKHPWWLKSKDEWVRSWAPPSVREREVLHNDEIYRRNQFAHQWRQHPTLSRREAKQRKRLIQQRGLQ